MKRRLCLLCSLFFLTGCEGDISTPDSSQVTMLSSDTEYLHYIADSEKEEHWKEQNYFQKTIDDFHSNDKLKYNEEIADGLMKINYTAIENNIADNMVLILTSIGMIESYYGGISTYDTVDKIELTWYDGANEAICVQTFTKNSEQRYVSNGEIIWQNEDYKEEYTINK
ncbi:MAG: hypothetical protein MJ065_08490 [Oscillospiraceae bacterium]|nr:hypothetical protein [Oscillospiraceae bacterium]